MSNALPLSREIAPYRDYILGSRGEFTVAKDQNVRLRSGWFSDRSACYLAAGRPVITQDTGVRRRPAHRRGAVRVPGDGGDPGRARGGERRLRRHAAAAREIAEGHFKAETVLTRLLEDCGLPVPG